MDYIKQNFGNICLCFSPTVEKKLDSLEPFDIIQFVDRKRTKVSFLSKEGIPFIFNNLW